MKRLFLVCALLVAGSAWAQAPQGKVNTPIADVTVGSAATLIAPLDSSRVALSCTNNDASVAVRWGSSAVTATSGQQLKAGASIEILSRDAVYMISEGATVTVSCTKETLQ